MDAPSVPVPALWIALVLNDLLAVDYRRYMSALAELMRRAGDPPPR